MAAADITALRLGALEVATTTQSWEEAEKLELVSDDEVMLITPSMRLQAQKEVLQDQKLRRNGNRWLGGRNYTPYSKNTKPEPWKGKPKGGGKGKKGKKGRGWPKKQKAPWPKNQEEEEEE